MISSAYTMRTKAILVLTLFTLILLVPASSAANQTDTSNTTALPMSTAASTEAPSDKLGPSSDHTPMTTGKKVSKQKDGTSASSTGASRPTTTSQLDQFTSSAKTTNTTGPSKSSSYKFMIFGILLAIVVLMLIVGCLHYMRDQHSGQERSVPRLLLGVRERLRMGLRLWPGGKRGEENDEEAEGRQREEEGQRRDDGGEGGSPGARNKEKGGHNEEDSDSSGDYSSLEGDNLRERALSRQDEEERKQSENEDGEETSSASEGGQSAVVGESSGDKKGSSEEIALVSSPQEDVEKADLCDVTVL